MVLSPVMGATVVMVVSFEADLDGVTVDVSSEIDRR